MTNGQRCNEEDKLDQILIEIGEFELPQLWKYFLILIPIALYAAYSTSFVVTASNMDYRCRVPECESDEELYDESWVKYAIPHSNGRPEKCLRYTINITNLSDPQTEKCPSLVFNTKNILKCNEYVFRSNEHRLLREFNLYCEENEYKLAMVGVINSIGGLLFMPLTGRLSDKFGRLTILVAGALLNSIFGLIKTFSTSYIMFLMFEFLDSSAGTCTYMAAFVLGVEWVSSKYRVLSCTIISLFYPCGEIFLGLLAMCIPQMRTLLLILYLTGLVVTSYKWLIPESVRWLLVTGRIDRAHAILQKSAKANNKVLSSTSEAIFTQKALESQMIKEQDNKNISLSTIITTRVLAIRLILCSLFWIVTFLVFYGLALNATTIQDDENKYMSFILVIMAELPGNLIMNILLDRIGRKWTLCGSMNLAGLVILSSQLIDQSQIALKRVFLFFAMCFASCAFSTIFVFTAEIWPTSARNTMMCICSSLGRLGSIAAPLTVLLNHVTPELPFIVYGVNAIIVGQLILLLPETLNKTLPDTIEEAINL